jgi:hypothetical protein
MSYYANGASVREIDAQLFGAWVAAGNPKSAGWTLIADPPSARHSWNGSAWVGPSLATLKSERIEADRQECQARIYSVWPLAKQISLGLGGVYDAADAADCAVWVNANIDASNAARDIINAESTDTPEKIAAVVVAWPTYTGG